MQPSIIKIITGTVINQKFGRWTVVSEVPIENRPFHKKRFYKCLCECGKIKMVQKNHLLSGASVSCGCFRKEVLLKCSTKHNLTNKHPLYTVWKNMNQRCTNTNKKQFKDWGGRGICACKAWKNDFQAFFDWAISNGWAKGLIIDRENNDGNYTPENCRFVTPLISSRNRRGTKYTKI